MLLKDTVYICTVLLSGLFALNMLFVSALSAIHLSGLSAEFSVNLSLQKWPLISRSTAVLALLITILMPLSAYWGWQANSARTVWVLALLLWAINASLTLLYFGQFQVITESFYRLIGNAQSEFEKWLLIHWPRLLLSILTFLMVHFASIKSIHKGERSLKM